MHSSSMVGGASPRRIFRGQSLARRKQRLTRQQLGDIAAAILDEPNASYIPTQQQLANNLGLTVGDIRKARNGHARKYQKPSLAKVLQAATAEERAIAARTLGAEWLYNNLVVLL
jgi:hypothetical protein